MSRRPRRPDGGPGAGVRGQRAGRPEHHAGRFRGGGQANGTGAPDESGEADRTNTTSGTAESPRLDVTRIRTVGVELIWTRFEKDGPARLLADRESDDATLSVCMVIAWPPEELAHRTAEFPAAAETLRTLDRPVRAAPSPEGRRRGPVADRGRPVRRLAQLPRRPHGPGRDLRPPRDVQNPWAHHQAPDPRRAHPLRLECPGRSARDVPGVVIGTARGSWPRWLGSTRSGPYQRIAEAEKISRILR